MIEPGAPLIADMSHHNSMSLLALLNGHPKVKGVIHKATQGMRFADERFAGRATEAAVAPARLSNRERTLTPEPFADLLLKIARLSYR